MLWRGGQFSQDFMISSWFTILPKTDNVCQLQSGAAFGRSLFGADADETERRPRLHPFESKHMIRALFVCLLRTHDPLRIIDTYTVSGEEFFYLGPTSGDTQLVRLLRFKVPRSMQSSRSTLLLTK